MTSQELINSGLLELYVLGQLEGEDLTTVENAIETDSAVRSELREIESAMAKFAGLHALPVDLSILDRALDQINSQEGQSQKYDRSGTSQSRSSAPNKTVWSWAGPLALVAAVIAMSIAYIQMDKSSKLTEEMDAIMAECEETQNELRDQELLYAALRDEGNRPVLIEATEKYPDTKLIIHHNEEEGTNYLQISNLPQLEDGLAFQLWSLKGSDAPIPLTVIIEGDNAIIPIDYEPGTNAYAITIEQAGGSPTPNLDALIGVFSLG